MDSRNDQPSVFLTLPKDVRVEVIREFLDAQAILNSAKAYKRFYSLFSEGPVYAHTCGLLKNLLSHTALGEWEKAENIWKLFPALLNCHGTVYHPNYIYENNEAIMGIPFYVNPGRYKYVNMTAWQIALVNEEFAETEKMGQLMTEEEKQKQFAEIFPDGKIINHNWNLKKAKRLLEAVFAAVIRDENIDVYDPDKMNTSTRTALYALYNYVKPKPEHKTGLIFDAKLYINALRLFEGKYDQFQRWQQHSFWNVRVEEWLAACLGTFYLRPHAQGIDKFTHRRGCYLSDGDKSSYFTFRRPSNSIFGFNEFVFYKGININFGNSRGTGGLRPAAAFFRSIYDGSISARIGISQQYSQPHINKISVT